MNKNFWLLLKIRFISQLRLNTFRLEKDKKKKNNRMLITCAVTLVILMGAFYCGAIAYGLEVLELGHLIPVYGFILCTILSLFFTIFKANGELFAYKDYEMLMSLPIETSTVIASRFMYLYVWNTFLSAIIMLSMGGVYAVYEKPSILFYIVWLLSIFVISLIPTTIATIIGALITAIASKSRHSSLISTFLTIIMLVLVFAASLFSGGMEEDFDLSQLEKIYNIVLNKVYDIYPIAKLYQNAVAEENIVSFLLFVALSIAWYLLFVKVLSLKYKQINTGITTFRGHNDYEIGSLKSSNALGALYSKEVKRFFSSTVYATNTGMGLILAIILSVALAVSGADRLAKLIGYEEISMILPKVAAFLLAAMVSMSCTSCVSLSLEGKNVWIIKTLPLTSEDIFNSKILVNLTFTVPVSIICGILFAIGTKANLFEAFMMVLLPLAYAFFSAVWGIFINTKFVNYEWESETQVVKQSISSILGMIGGLFLAVIPGILAAFLNGVYYRIYMLFLVVLLFVLAAALYKGQMKKSI